LPEIPDYERPELEKYEKSDFEFSNRVSWNNRGSCARLKNVAE
jgi:hypothetical protein